MTEIELKKKPPVEGNLKEHSLRKCGHYKEALRRGKIPRKKI